MKLKWSPTSDYFFVPTNRPQPKRYSVYYYERIFTLDKPKPGNLGFLLKNDKQLIDYQNLQMNLQQSSNHFNHFAYFSV